MRKSICLIALLLLLGVGVFAQVIVPGAKFKLISPAELDLNMFYSTELQRLYVQADFELEKALLDPTQYNGVFLNRDARLQSLTIAGRGEGYYFVNNISPQHFEPELSYPELLKEDNPARFHGLSINNYQNYPDTVHVTLMYYLDLPEFRINEMNKLCSGFEANQYWYPHDLVSSTVVKVKLDTTPFYTLLLGNSFAQFTDKDFKRTHKCTFIAPPDQPVNLRLIKD